MSATPPSMVIVAPVQLCLWVAKEDVLTMCLCGRVCGVWSEREPSVIRLKERQTLNATPDGR